MANSLDYETTTSYSLTITASDGTNSTQETLSISVTDIIEFALALNSNSVSINEDVSSGSQVATSTLLKKVTMLSLIHCLEPIAISFQSPAAESSLRLQL